MAAPQQAPAGASAAPPPPPDAAVATPSPPGSVPAADSRFDDIHTARAFKRIAALDEAFWDGYQALLASIRAPSAVKPKSRHNSDDGPTHRRRRRSSTVATEASDDAASNAYLDAPVNHVVATFPDYLAARSKLLLLKVGQRWAAHVAAGGARGTPPAVDRFQLSQLLAGNPSDPVLEPSASDISYFAWRRHLLRSKFEARRAACEDEELRRLAAEAMQRAMVAEQAERRRHLELEEALTAAENKEEEVDDRGWGLSVALEELYAPRGLAYTVGIRFCVAPPGGEAAPVSSTAAAAPGAGLGLMSPVTRGRKPAAVSGVSATACLRFTPDSVDHFAAGFEDGSVALCSAVHGCCWALLTGHTGAVSAVDWGAGGAYLLTVSVDRTARLWAVKAPPEAPLPPGGIAPRGTDGSAPPPPVGSASCVRIVYRDNAVTHALFFPMNPNLFVVVEVVDAATATSAAHGRNWRRTVMRRGGRILNRFSRRSVLSVVNVSTGKVVTQVKFSSQVSDLTFTANGRQLYIADMAGLLHLYVVESNFQKQASQPFSDHKTVFGRVPARSLAVYDNPQQRRRRSALPKDGQPPLPTVSYRQVGLRHRVAGMLRRRFRSNDAVYFTTLRFKPYDAALRCPLLVGTDNRGVTRALRIVGGHFEEVDKFDFVIKPATGVFVRHSTSLPSTETDFVFVGTEHGEVHLLNPHGKTAASQRVARLAAHARRITALDVSRDEAVMVSADETGGIVVWNRSSRGSAPLHGDDAVTAGTSAGASAGGGEAAGTDDGGAGGVPPPHAASGGSADVVVSPPGAGGDRHKVAQSLCPVCTRPVPDDRMLTHVEDCLQRAGR